MYDFDENVSRVTLYKLTKFLCLVTFIREIFDNICIFIRRRSKDHYKHLGWTTIANG